MQDQEFSVGLDIGTTKIVAIVGRKNTHGKIEVMGVGKAKSRGVHKGIVNNITQTIESIKKAVEAAEKSAGVSIKRVTVGIAGKHIRSLQHSDYIMREKPESYISEKDIEALKNQVNKLVMLPGEQIIHILPQEYKVDSEGEIQEPIGMVGTRLEANFHVVVGQMNSISNIEKCVREAGLEIESLTLEPLASSEAVLIKEEKEAGVAIVDIGGGTTDIAVFKNNIIRHTCVIPYGGNIITDDIREGCSIIEKYAEQLKIQFGSAVPDLEKENTFVTIPGLNGRPDKEISTKTLSKIIGARVEEILAMVDNQLKAYGAFEQKKKLIAGIVLTGGGSNLKNIRQLSNYITGFDCRLGYANEFISNDKNQTLKGPEYATAIGLLMENLAIRSKKINSNLEKDEKLESNFAENSSKNNTFVGENEADEDETNVSQKQSSKISRFSLNGLVNRVKTLLEEKED